MSDYGYRRSGFPNHGTAQYWYGRRQLHRGENHRDVRTFKLQPGQPVELNPIVDPDNLLAVYYMRRGQAGQAPGIDGIRYADLGRSEIASAARAISKAIKQRTYRPLPAREKAIAKPKGGTRTLKITTVLDRTVAAAVNYAIAPLIERELLPSVMGCRQGHSVHKLLAELDNAVTVKGRTVIAKADIVGAFDNVPVSAAVDAYRHLLTNSASNSSAGSEDLIWLIDTILTGHDPSSTTGIAQGCPLSPPTLNTLLNQVLDRPLVAALPGTPFWRYLDDQVWACQSVTEGQRAIHTTCHLLDKAGFKAKGKPTPVNLRRQGAYIDILGYRIRYSSTGQLDYELTQAKWQDLRNGLLKAHTAPIPTETAQDVVRGWIAAHGPVFDSAEKRSISLQEISRTSARYGYREIGPREIWEDTMQETYGRWDTIRRDTLLARHDASVPLPIPL